MIKICTIDLDGTLFDNKKNISEENIIAIKKARDCGCKIVIATGRPYNGVRPVLEKLGLTTEDDYVICYNGAKVMNAKTLEIIHDSCIDMKALNLLYQASLTYNISIHAFLLDETLITTKHNPYTDIEARINKITDYEVDFTKLPADSQFLKIMLVDSETNLNNVENVIPSEIYETYSMVRSSKIFLEFLNKNTDKGKALTYLADHLNIDLKDTMAIGDAGNDLSMITTASIGVAMANGFDYIKQAADFVTLDNEHNGVAYAINKFILKTENL